MHLNLHILPLRSLFRTFSFECEGFECTLNECKCNILQESTTCSGSASMFFFFLIRRFVHYSLTHSTSIEKYSDRIRFDFSNLMRCSYLKLSIILQLFIYWIICYEKIHLKKHRLKFTSFTGGGGGEGFLLNSVWMYNDVIWNITIAELFE